MAKPRNIVPVVGEAERASGLAGAAPAQLPNLTYHHGPLLTAVEVTTIFWGADWEKAPQSQVLTGLNAFFDDILTSALIDLLAEYSVPGKAIGHGRRVGTATVTTPPLGHTHKHVSDAHIQAQLKAWTADGTVGAPNANSLYFVYLPPGVTAVASDGTHSCTVFCGYHGVVKGTSIHYAVEPYVTCQGCTFGNGVLDSLTKVSSHELCEAITDPESGGWYDDSSGEEIGDICNTSVTTLGGHTIQREWSDKHHACMPA